MQTSLKRIAAKAAEKKEYRFLGLYTMLNEEFLIETWPMLNKRAAYGVDKVSYQDYQENLRENIRDLVSRLKRKSYKAKLIRRKYIPKANGKLRPLGIPAIEDKLLQLAVSRILTAIYEQDFGDCMYGYRPGRNPRQVLDKLQDTLQFKGYRYVVEADIKGFFDNLDHDWLMKMLAIRVNDGPMLRLIMKWLKAGIIEKDSKVICPRTGSPQGGVISPLLANLYMHHVLVLWFDKVLKKRMNGQAKLFIYADDFVAIFENEEDAKKFYMELPGRLNKFGLEVAPEKTNIHKFDKDDYPGSGTFEFLGFEFIRTVSRKGYDFVKRLTVKKRFESSLKVLKAWCVANRSVPIKLFMAKLRVKITGYINYYGLPGNDRLYKFVYLARRTVYKWLNRRSQRKSYNWNSFKRMLIYYDFPRAKAVFPKKESQIYFPTFSKP